MNKMRSLAITLAATALLFGVAVVPAYAEQGSDDTSTTTSETDNSGSNSAEMEDASEHDATDQQRVRSAEDNFRHRGKLLLEEAKNRHSGELSEKLREKRCEGRKPGLLTRVDKIAANAQRAQTRIDAVFAKAVTFESTANLPEPEGTTYAALIDAAETAQATSKASVEALANVKPTTIDCSTNSAAEQVATFKAAATQARTDLKAYKKAVKALIIALKDAKETQESQEQ